MRGAILSVALLLAAPASAGSPDISARRLVAEWSGQDPERSMLAEVIASAFAGGLSWRGSLAAKEIYCPPPDFKGGQVMTALQKFLEEHPDMAERPYDDAMAASLSLAYPCRTN